MGRLQENSYGTVNDSTTTKKPSGWGTRYTFSIMAFLGFANVYAMRVNLSVAIVAMVKSTGNNTDYGTECGNYTEDEDSSNNNDGNTVFDWDSKQQGLILGAFFYGYISTQVLGGMMAERIGGKWLFGLGTLVTAILTLLTPIAAEAGTGMFIAVRVLEGIGEGVTFPAMHAMIAKWIPIEERAKLAAFIWAGAQAGTVISLPLSGVLADEVSWQSVFYVFGAFGCVWFVFWVFLCFDTPAQHPRISTEERHYIESGIPGSNGKESSERKWPPFIKILTNYHFLALIVCHMGQNWGFYTLLTEIPTYLSNIQHFSLKTNGFLSALPYLLMWMFTTPTSWIADWLIARGTLSTGATRKISNSIAFVGPALALVGLSFVGCDKTMSIVWLCISVGLNGAIYSGFQVNHVDLSPKYAGTLMGITNTFANIAGFVTPYIAGSITNNNQTKAAWRIVFLLSSAVYVVCDLVFVVFGSGELQPFDAL